MGTFSKHWWYKGKTYLVCEEQHNLYLIHFLTFRHTVWARVSINGFLTAIEYQSLLEPIVRPRAAQIREHFVLTYDNARLYFGKTVGNLLEQHNIQVLVCTISSLESHRAWDVL